MRQRALLERERAAAHAELWTWAEVLAGLETQANYIRDRVARARQAVTDIEQHITSLEQDQAQIARAAIL